MSTAESVMNQIGKLISDAEGATGKHYDTLSEAVEDLILGYGTGGGDSGGEEVCGHVTTTTEYISNDDGSHTVKTVCAGCGEVMPSKTESCPDEDNDGLCDVCAGQMPTEPEDNAKWEYQAKELQSRSGYVFSVLNGALNATSNNNYVALGAKSSGSTPAAIPIPADATKLTITFGETGTKKVYFLFFTGSPSNVTTFVDEHSADVVNGVCTFEGRGATYVVFNCTGSWTTIQKSQVGELASLKFE